MSKVETKNKKRASRTFYRYSECFKEKVIQEISAGSSISAVCRRYDIKNMSTVSKWIKKYGRSKYKIKCKICQLISGRDT